MREENYNMMFVLHILLMLQEEGSETCYDVWVGTEIFKVLNKQTDKQFVILLKKKNT